MESLIVEDSKSYQKILENIFNNLGLNTRCVECGNDALEWTENERYDLICLDLNLPDMDGFELCRQLRKNKAYSLTPIVLLTADEESTLQKQGFDAGVTEIFRKTAFEELQNGMKNFVDRLRRVIRGRVLYVEDSPTTAQLTQHILKSEQLEIVHFNNAEAALESLMQNDYDLIITDILLAGELSGLGLIRSVRSLDDDKNRLPILALSGEEDAARKIEILRQGANDYISKPIINEEFIARIGNLLSNKHLFDQVKEQEEELHKLAMTDQLTGLYNRHYLQETAVKYISNAYRSSRPLSLLLVDLDHFKAINDNHGHFMGDCVLAEVGHLLTHSCRKGDLAVRFGGEEFIIILNDSNMEAAMQKAEFFRIEIEKLQPEGLSVSASIGVATLPLGKKIEFEELFKNADNAVYAAKENGRNRVHSFDE